VNWKNAGYFAVVCGLCGIVYGIAHERGEVDGIRQRAAYETTAFQTDWRFLGWTLEDWKTLATMSKWKLEPTAGNSIRIELGNGAYVVRWPEDSDRQSGMVIAGPAATVSRVARDIDPALLRWIEHLRANYSPFSGKVMLPMKHYAIERQCFPIGTVENEKIWITGYP
jgi:hypothetical protein